MNEFEHCMLVLHCTMIHAMHLAVHLIPNSQSHDLSNINSSVVDCDGATIPNHSRLTWDQSNGSPCKTSNVARSAVGSVTSGGSPAKLVRRQLRTVDDRLRLSEPSVLSPPKVRFLTRDCVSRDANVSGPQMPTTNGVNRTPFFQLPT